MQDLSEGVFISMANFTLAHRDSYLDYLHAGVKQDTLTALCTAPVHLHSLFPDQLITKAEEESVEVKRGVLLTNLTDVKVAFTLMLPVTGLSGNPAWKQIRDSRRQESDYTFSFRLLCCKCSFCYMVATKERRKSQLLLQPGFQIRVGHRSLTEFCNKTPNFK